ncbi:putative Ig domain-containing protein [Burkholderia ambifaria]|uniref:Ig family protein n=1 Tax=Burkholderia ambifaria MEX-5 TaxID=396597 RepID=B1TG05_9BURK|nr:putative Ig domain-containing protein [Burkholderia ambifaria]EDT37500.1 Ig family protein [Burkholderia ambifaria MEX-5]
MAAATVGIDFKEAWAQGDYLATISMNPAPPKSWTYSSSDLPHWLTISDNTLHGTPTHSATINFTITATPPEGDSLQPINTPLQITVHEAIKVTPEVSDMVFNARAGEKIGRAGAGITFQAKNGETTIDGKWEIKDSAKILPKSLTFDADKGVLSGTIDNTLAPKSETAKAYGAHYGFELKFTAADNRNKNIKLSLYAIRIFEKLSLKQIIIKPEAGHIARKEDPIEIKIFTETAGFSKKITYAWKASVEPDKYLAAPTWNADGTIKTTAKDKGHLKAVVVATDENGYTAELPIDLLIVDSVTLAVTPTPDDWATNDKGTVFGGETGAKFSMTTRELGTVSVPGLEHTYSIKGSTPAGLDKIFSIDAGGNVVGRLPNTVTTPTFTLTIQAISNSGNTSAELTYTFKVSTDVRFHLPAAGISPEVAYIGQKKLIDLTRYAEGGPFQRAEFVTTVSGASITGNPGVILEFTPPDASPEGPQVVRYKLFNTTGKSSENSLTIQVYEKELQALPSPQPWTVARGSTAEVVIAKDVPKEQTITGVMLSSAIPEALAISGVSALPIAGDAVLKVKLSALAESNDKEVRVFYALIVDGQRATNVQETTVSITAPAP